MSNPVGIATTVVTLPSLDGLAAVTDERLLELEAEVTNARRTVDAAKVAIVAELVRRSDPALGHAGLAARLGAPTPEKAIQALGECRGAKPENSPPWRPPSTRRG